MKAYLTLSAAALLGLATFGTQSARAAEISCDDVAGLAASITQAVSQAPSLAATIAGKETARCPADAAAIATAAVNAAPNGSQDIVDAVLAALPDDMKDDPILTGALTELAREGGHGSFNLSRLGAPLIAPWTDVRKGRIVTSDNIPNNPPNSSPH